MVLTGEVTVGGLGQVPPGGLVLFPASVRQEWEISAIPRTRVLAVSIAQA
jgi:hypothetical protein